MPYQILNILRVSYSKKINGFLMNQFMNINVSKNGPFVLRLFRPSFLSLFLSSSLSLLVS